MKYLYSIFFCSLLLTACSKKMEVEAPEFQVRVDKASYKLGDTVIFSFEGKPENIVFYSGEGGKNYDNRERTQATGKVQLEFTSYIANKGQDNTLQLLASTNFSGTVNAEGIAAATWTDISTRCILSTGVDKTSSGIVDLSDFAALNKPLYLAFRYTGYKHNTLKQPTWAIRTFDVNNVLPEGTYSITNSTSTGWRAADLKNSTVVWDIRSTGQLVITGNSATTINEDNEDWAISRPLILSVVTPDIGEPIRDVGSASLSNYKYVFAKTGTYTVTFLAFNNTVDDYKSVLRQIEVTIVQ